MARMKVLPRAQLRRENSRSEGRQRIHVLTNGCEPVQQSVMGAIAIKPGIIVPISATVRPQLESSTHARLKSLVRFPRSRHTPSLLKASSEISRRKPPNVWSSRGMSRQGQQPP